MKLGKQGLWALMAGAAVWLAGANVASAQTPPPDQVALTVNLITGEVRLVGNATDPGELASYQVNSISASLESANWNSLADQGQSGFVEFTQTDSSVIEGTFGGPATINAAGRTLGPLFDTVEGLQDLIFLYGEEDAGGIITNFTGTVTYVPEPTSLAVIGGAALLLGRRRRA